MFFEGNEMKAIRKQKVKEEDMLLLSVDEGLDEFERASVLLQKSNKIQVMAATVSLPALAKTNPL